jgi:RNAse (barnase) inhibitor barstar
MKRVVIDGLKFNDINGLFDEIQEKLCPGFNEFGRNYNAVVDVLEGGFGVHEYEEPLLLIWSHSEKSARDLGKDFDDLLVYIREMNHVTLELK